MIRKSNNRQELVQSLSALIPAAQTETHAVDEAAANRLRINGTDLRCLGAVLEQGSVSASRLAEIVGLTRGAMTTALDRLERAGFVRRIRDRQDRRSIKIEATPAAKKGVHAIWQPIRADGLDLLKTYSDAELELLLRFFTDYCALHRAHAGRIRRMRRKSRGTDRPETSTLGLC